MTKNRYHYLYALAKILIYDIILLGFFVRIQVIRFYCISTGLN
jgi:hypothetical protein